MAFTKWLGGAMGWAYGGPIGALLGFIFGSLFDNISQAQPKRINIYVWAINSVGSSYESGWETSEV